MYLSFEPKTFSVLLSADSQSTKQSVSEHMVDPVNYNFYLLLRYHLLFTVLLSKFFGGVRTNREGVLSVRGRTIREGVLSVRAYFSAVHFLTFQSLLKIGMFFSDKGKFKRFNMASIIRYEGSYVGSLLIYTNYLDSQRDFGKNFVRKKLVLGNILILSML